MRRAISITEQMVGGRPRWILTLRQGPERYWVSSVGNRDGYATLKEATRVARQLRALIREGRPSWEVMTATSNHFHEVAR
jgi:hypothetical protein